MKSSASISSTSTRWIKSGLLVLALLGWGTVQAEENPSLENVMKRSFVIVDGSVPVREDGGRPILACGFRVAAGRYGLTVYEAPEFSSVTPDKLLLFDGLSETITMAVAPAKIACAASSVVEITNVESGFRTYRSFATLKPGEKVLLISSSDGQQFHSSVGTISSVASGDAARKVFDGADTGTVLTDVIVHTAKTPYGISKGLLLDSAGEPIGLNFGASFPDDGSASEFGYAVPMERVIAERRIVGMKAVGAPDGSPAAGPEAAAAKKEAEAELNDKLKTGEWSFEMAEDSETSGTAKQANK